MTAIAVERFLIILLILITGVLALAEIAVVSARKVRLQQRGEEGDAGARAAWSWLMPRTAFCPPSRLAARSSASWLAPSPEPP